ncbi:expansin-like B1 [Lotus japonicus]|uniref:expansin-like B1 n=1 Tax=Lotus japonicus TaxID=34305 RepID=UPI002585D3D8|nr:expansin-like B1 [Lotus japonicus]
MELNFKHQLGLICVILIFPALCSGKEYYTKSRAAYYGTSDGYGNPRGACGFGGYGRTVNDGNVAAVSAKLWKNGGGCGACYQVRCKIPLYCDYNGAYVVATDSGEGDRTDFILSHHAFSKLGRNKNASEALKKYGVLDVEYKRVPCTFKGNNIVFQINEHSSNPGYFAIVILYVGGTSDITSVEILRKEYRKWEPLRRVYGAVFDIANPPTGEIRLKFLVSDGSAGFHWVQPKIAIPANWKAGATYSAKLA